MSASGNEQKLWIIDTNYAKMLELGFVSIFVSESKQCDLL